MLIDEIKKRELNVFEAFGLGRIIYARNARPVFELVVLLGIPITILYLLVFEAWFGLIEGVDIMQIAADPRLLEQFMLTEVSSYLALYSGLLLLIQVVFYPLITLSIAKATLNYMEGEGSNALKIIGEVLRKGHIIIPVSLISSIVVYPGLFFIQMPGLQLLALINFACYVYLIFTECEIILGGKGVFGSLKHSFYLVRGHFLKTTLFGVMIYAVNNSVSYLVGIIFGAMATNLFMSVVSNILSMFISSYFTVIVVVYYISRLGVKEREEQPDENGFF